jgi:hypothetical protein
MKDRTTNKFRRILKKYKWIHAGQIVSIWRDYPKFENTNFKNHYFVPTTYTLINHYFQIGDTKKRVEIPINYLETYLKTLDNYNRGTTNGQTI